MSYVNKKERIFRYGEPFDIPHARSEGRIKKYWSATDRRAWCDEVEQRRQHILELNARNKGQFCLENFIPLDFLFNAMAASKDMEVAKLQKRIEYLEALLDIYKQIELTPEQQKQVDDLNATLGKERKKLEAAERDRDAAGAQEVGRRPKDRKGLKRHSKNRSNSESEVVNPEKRKRPSSAPEIVQRNSDKIGGKKRPRPSAELDQGPSEDKAPNKKRTKRALRIEPEPQALTEDKGIPDVQKRDNAKKPKGLKTTEGTKKSGDVKKTESAKQPGDAKTSDYQAKTPKKEEKPMEKQPAKKLESAKKDTKAKVPPVDTNQEEIFKIAPVVRDKSKDKEMKPDEVGGRGRGRGRPKDQTGAAKQKDVGEIEAPTSSSQEQGRGRGRGTPANRSPGADEGDKNPSAKGRKIISEDTSPKETPKDVKQEPTIRDKEKDEDEPLKDRVPPLQAAPVKGRGRGKAGAASREPPGVAKKEGPTAITNEDKEEKVGPDKGSTTDLVSPSRTAQIRGRGRQDNDTEKRPGKVGKASSPDTVKQKKLEPPAVKEVTDRDSPSKTAQLRGRGRPDVGSKKNPGDPVEEVVKPDTNKEKELKPPAVKEVTNKSPSTVVAEDKDRDSPSKNAEVRGRGRGRSDVGSTKSPGNPIEEAVKSDKDKELKPSAVKEVNNKPPSTVDVQDKGFLVILKQENCGFPLLVLMNVPRPRHPEIWSQHFDPSDIIIKKNGLRYVKLGANAQPIDPLFFQWEQSLTYSSDSTSYETPSRKSGFVPPFKDKENELNTAVDESLLYDRDSPSKNAQVRGRGRGRPDVGNKKKPGNPVEEVVKPNTNKEKELEPPAVKEVPKMSPSTVDVEDKDRDYPSKTAQVRGRGRGRPDVGSKKRPGNPVEEVVKPDTNKEKELEPSAFKEVTNRSPSTVDAEVRDRDSPSKTAQVRSRGRGRPDAAGKKRPGNPIEEVVKPDTIKEKELEPPAVKQVTDKSQSTVDPEDKDRDSPSKIAQVRGRGRGRPDVGSKKTTGIPGEEVVKPETDKKIELEQTAVKEVTNKSPSKVDIEDKDRDSPSKIAQVRGRGRGRPDVGSKKRPGNAVEEVVKSDKDNKKELEPPLVKEVTDKSPSKVDAADKDRGAPPPVQGKESGKAAPAKNRPGVTEKEEGAPVTNKDKDVEMDKLVKEIDDTFTGVVSPSKTAQVKGRGKGKLEVARNEGPGKPKQESKATIADNEVAEEPDKGVVSPSKSALVRGRGRGRPEIASKERPGKIEEEPKAVIGEKEKEIEAPAAQKPDKGKVDEGVVSPSKSALVRGRGRGKPEIANKERPGKIEEEPKAVISEKEKEIEPPATDESAKDKVDEGPSKEGVVSPSKSVLVRGRGRGRPEIASKERPRKIEEEPKAVIGEKEKGNEAPAGEEPDKDKVDEGPLKEGVVSPSKSALDRGRGRGRGRPEIASKERPGQIEEEPKAVIGEKEKKIEAPADEEPDKDKVDEGPLKEGVVSPSKSALVRGRGRGRGRPEIASKERPGKIEEEPKAVIGEKEKGIEAPVDEEPDKDKVDEGSSKEGVVSPSKSALVRGRGRGRGRPEIASKERPGKIEEEPKAVIGEKEKGIEAPVDEEPDKDKVDEGSSKEGVSPSKSALVRGRGRGRPEIASKERPGKIEEEPKAVMGEKGKGIETPAGEEPDKDKVDEGPSKEGVVSPSKSALVRGRGRGRPEIASKERPGKIEEEPKAVIGEKEKEIAVPAAEEPDKDKVDEGPSKEDVVSPSKSALLRGRGRGRPEIASKERPGKIEEELKEVIDGKGKEIEARAVEEPDKDKVDEGPSKEEKSELQTGEPASREEVELKKKDVKIPDRRPQDDKAAEQEEPIKDKSKTKAGKAEETEIGTEPLETEKSEDRPKEETPKKEAGKMESKIEVVPRKSGPVEVLPKKERSKTGPGEEPEIKEKGKPDDIPVDRAQKDTPAPVTKVPSDVLIRDKSKEGSKRSKASVIEGEVRKPEEEADKEKSVQTVQSIPISDKKAVDILPSQHEEGKLEDIPIDQRGKATQVLKRDESKESPKTSIVEGLALEGKKAETLIDKEKDDKKAESVQTVPSKTIPDKKAIEGPPSREKEERPIEKKLDDVGEPIEEKDRTSLKEESRRGIIAATKSTETAKKECRSIICGPMRSRIVPPDFISGETPEPAADVREEKSIESSEKDGKADSTLIKLDELDVTPKESRRVSMPTTKSTGTTKIECRSVVCGPMRSHIMPADLISGETAGQAADVREGPPEEKSSELLKKEGYVPHEKVSAFTKDVVKVTEEILPEKIHLLAKDFIEGKRQLSNIKKTVGVVSSDEQLSDTEKDKDQEKAGNESGEKGREELLAIADKIDAKKLISKPEEVTKEESEELKDRKFPDEPIGSMVKQDRAEISDHTGLLEDTAEGRTPIKRAMDKCQAICNLVPINQQKQSEIVLDTIDLECLPMNVSDKEQQIPEIGVREVYDEKEIHEKEITIFIPEGTEVADSKYYTASEEIVVLDDKARKPGATSPYFVKGKSRGKESDISVKDDKTIPSDISHTFAEKQKESFLLTISKDEATETKKADHKCIAACRNAKERPTIFGEETGGVVMGTDTETPHDLVPPGYYLPDDMTPRQIMPEWANIPETTIIQQDNLSLSETTEPTISESEKAIWIVPKPEEQILEAPKGIPNLEQEWETDTETFADLDHFEISDDIKMGNHMSRVLSGQVVGLPFSSPLLDRTSPHTLSEAIYQQKLSSKVCKAYCARKETDKDALEDGPLETVEDVSDINTDSEIAEEFYDSEVVKGFEEVLLVETNNEVELHHSDLSKEAKLDETAVSPGEVFVTANSFTSESEKIDADVKDLKGVTKTVQFTEDSEQTVISRGDLSTEVDKIQATLSSEQTYPMTKDFTPNKLDEEFQDAPDFTIEPPTFLSDLKEEEKERKKSVIIQDHISEPHLVEVIAPRRFLSESEVTSISTTVEEKSSQMVEEEFADAQTILDIQPKTSKHTVDAKAQTVPEIPQNMAPESIKKSREVSVETVPKEISTRYVEAIEKMPLPKQDEDVPRFANWFSPASVFSKPIQGKPKCLAPCARASNIKITTEMADKSVTLEPRTSVFETSTKPEYTQTQKSIATTTEGTYKLENCLKPPKKVCRATCAQINTDEMQLPRDELADECRATCAQIKTNEIELSRDEVADECRATCAHINPDDIQLSKDQLAYIDKFMGQNCNGLFLNGHLKSMVYMTPVDTKEQLWQRIQDATNNLRGDEEHMQEVKCRATCAHINTDEIQLLRDELAAKEAYCAEQRKIATAALEQLENIKNIVEERDDLRKKLQTSQYELADLKKNIESMGFGDSKNVDKKKSEVYVPFKASASSMTNSCDEEIMLLEDEIKEMRTSYLTPNEETKVIKKEVEVLKRYCAKLSTIQEENATLKKHNMELQRKCQESEEKLQMFGCEDKSAYQDIQEKLLTLNETVAERNVLQNRVKQLETELNAYQDLPEDIELFKRRSLLLDDVLKDRDRLAKRLEQMRGIDDEIVTLRLKAERVDELERQLRMASRDVQAAEDELDSMRNKCTMAEIELLNQKTEADTLRSKIICMEHENESLKSMCKEQEVLQIEKGRLQASLDELVRMQDDYEHMCVQMKSLDVLKAEKDRYKRKYEELASLEGECNMLRDQLNKAKIIEKEKDALELQTEDLEKCICEQEDEIRRLVTHIDCLAQGKEEQQHKMKEVVSNLKTELEKKESLLILSEEQMNTMKGKIDSSFQDLSDETKNLRQNNKNLGKEIDDLKSANADLQQKLNKAAKQNANIFKELDDKNHVIETMQEVLKDRETCQADNEIIVYNSHEIIRLQNELKAAKFENQNLQELAMRTENNNQETNQQLRDMLDQSRTAVERIALELEQQYADWDCKKRYRCCPGCTCKQKGNKAEPEVIIRCCPGCNCKKKSNDDETDGKCGCRRTAKSADSSPRRDRCTTKRMQRSEGSPSLCQCRNRKNTAANTYNPSTGKDVETDAQELLPIWCSCDFKIGKGNVTNPRSGDGQCIIVGSTNQEVNDFRPVSSDTEDEFDEDQMYTARSVEETKAKIAELENELLIANNTIIQLQEKITIDERLAAENSALRRHSTEVQEVAKDQIEDLVNHLKKAKDRVAELEAKNIRLNFDLDRCQKRLQELGIQKDISGADEMLDMNTIAIFQSDLEECLKEKEMLLKLTEHLKHQLSEGQEGENMPDLAAFAQLKIDLEECLKDKKKLLAEIELFEQKPSTIPEPELFLKLKIDLEQCLKEKEKLLKQISELKEQLTFNKNQDQFNISKLRTEFAKSLKEKELETQKLAEDLKICKDRNGEVEARNCKLKFDLFKCQKHLEGFGIGKEVLDTEEMMVAKLQADFEECLKEKETLLKQIDHLKEQFTFKNNQDQSNLSKLKTEHQKCLKDKEVEIGILATGLKKAKDTIEGVEEINCKLKFDLFKCQKHLQEFEIQKESLVAKLQADFEECLKEREKLLKQVGDLEEQLTYNKSQDQSTKNKLRAETEKLVNDLKKAKDRSGEVEARNCKLKFDLFKCQKHLQQLGIQKEILNTEEILVAKLQADFEDCLKEREKLLKQIGDLKEQLTFNKAQDQSTKDELRAEMEKLVNDLKETKVRIAEVEARNCKLKFDLHRYQNHIQELSIKNEILRTEKIPAGKLHVVKDQPAFNQNQDQSNTDNLGAELQKCLNDKEAEIENLVKNLKSMKNRIGELEARNCKLKFDLLKSQKCLELQNNISDTEKIPGRKHILPFNTEIKVLKPIAGLEDYPSTDNLENKFKECLKEKEALLEMIKSLQNQLISGTTEDLPDMATFAKLKTGLEECLEDKESLLKIIEILQNQLASGMTEDSPHIGAFTAELSNILLEEYNSLEQIDASKQQLVSTKTADQIDSKIEYPNQLTSINTADQTDSNTTVLSELKKLKADLENCLNEKEALLKIIKGLQNQLTSGTSEDLPDMAEFVKLKAELQECYKERATLSKMAESLQNQMNQLASGMTEDLPHVAAPEKIKADLDDSIKEKENLLKQIDVLKKQVSSSNAADQSDLKADLEKCLKEKETLLKIIEEMQNQLASGTTKDLPDMAEFAKLKEELDYCLKEKEDLIQLLDVTPSFAKLKTELDDCLKEKENLLKQRAAVTPQVPSSRMSDPSDLEKLKSDLENCLKEKEALLKTINSLQNQLASSTTEDLHGMAAFAKLKSELNDCLKEKENLSKQLAAAKQQISFSKTVDSSDLENLKSDLEKCLKEKEALLKVIDGLQNQLPSGTTKDLPDMAEFAKLKGELDYCLKEKEDLIQLLDVTPSFAKLKTELDDCLKEKENWLKQRAAVTPQLPSSRTSDPSELEKLKVDLEKCLKEKEVLLKTIEGLKNQLASDATKNLPDMVSFIKLKAELDNCLKEKENLLQQLAVVTPSSKTADPSNLGNLKSDLEKCLKEKEGLLKTIDNLQNQLASGTTKDLPDMAAYEKLKAEYDNSLKEQEKLSKIIEELQKQSAVTPAKDKPDMTSFAKLKSDLENCLKEKDVLLKTINELKRDNNKLIKEKDDLDKMLMSNVVVTSKRSSKLENDLETISSQNKKQTAENEKLNRVNKDLANKNQDLMHQLAALQSENERLKMELTKHKENQVRLHGEVDNLRKSEIDPAVLDALKRENESLKKQLENLKKEMKEVLEKLKQPSIIPPINKLELEKDQKDKDAMQAIINDLENQLRSLSAKEKGKPLEPSDDFRKKIDELAKQLDDAQRRAEAAESTLRNLKASDPTAMLNSEMQKLKERLVQLEKENTSLKDVLAKANNEKAAFKKDLDNALNDAKKIKEQNDALQKTADNLKSGNDNLTKNLQKMKDDASGDSVFKAENERLKKIIAQLENEVEDFKIELDHAYTDSKKSAERINQLLGENGDLRKKLAQLEGENSKLKKDMDTALVDAKKAAEKLLEIEKENTKCKQTVKDLENEVARLKKELDSMLNDAKKNANTVSDLQKEIAELKQRITQLESINAKLDDENSKVKKELEQARGGSQAVAALQDEKNKLGHQNAALQSENDKLRKELEDALADAKFMVLTSSQLEDEIGNLKKRLHQLEAENVDLKKKLAAALADSNKTDIQEDYNKLKKKFATLENENSKLQKDLQTALDDGKKIKDELNELRQSEKKFKDKITQLEGDNGNLKKSLNTALDDLKKMGTEVTGIQGDESKLKQKVDILETENAKLKRDLEAALENARKTTADASALKDENSKLKQRIALLESENAKLKTDVDSATNQLKKTSDQAKLLQDENNKYKQKIGQLEDESGKLKQKLDAAPKEAKPSASPDDGSRQRLEDELGRLKKELNGVKAEAKDNNKELAQLKDENNRLKQKITQLEAENSKLKNNLDQLTDTAKAAEGDLARLKDNEAKLKDKITQLNNDIIKSQKEKAALADDKKKADSDLEKLSDLKDSENKLKQKIAQLEAENAKLKRDLDAALRDNKQLTEELNNNKSDNAKIKQELAKIEGEDKKLKKELDTAIRDVKKGAAGVDDLKEVDNKLKQRITQLETENARLKAELNNALDSAKKAANDLSKLRDEDNKLKQKIAQLEGENSKLKKDLDKASSDAKGNGDQIADLQNESIKLKQKIPQLESEISNLRKELEAALNDAKNKATGMSKLQDEINNLKQKNSQLEKGNEKLKKELETAIKDQKAESDTGKKMHDENNKQKQKISILEDELEKLKKELATAKSTPSSAVASKAPDDDDDRRKQLEQLNNENAKLKKELENALKEAQNIAELQNENSKLKQQVSKLQNEIEKIKKDLNSTLSEVKKNASELAKSKDNESKCKQRIAQLETENLKLKKNLDDAVSKAEEANSLKKENKKLEDQIKQLNDEINKLKSALAAVETKKGPVDETKDLKDEIAKLKQRIAKLEGENTKLKQQYDETKTELHSASISAKDSDKFLKDNNKLSAEINDLKKQLQKAKTANQTLPDENGNLKKKIEQLEQELVNTRNISDENEKLKKKIEQLQQELAKLKKDLNIVKDDLSNAVADLSKFKDENAKIKGENGKLQNDLKANKDQLNKALQHLEKFEGTDLDKHLKDYEIKIKQLEAELAKQKKDCEDTIGSLKSQFDRDIKILHKKNDANIEKLQKEHADIIKDLNEKHGKEIKGLRDAINRLRAELEAALKENDKLQSLLDDQKRKSIEIKDKVLEVEKVISKERRRSKDLEKKHSQLQSKTSVIEENIKLEQRKSAQIEEERVDLSKKLDQTVKKKQQVEQEKEILKAEKESLIKEKDELKSESDKLRKESSILEQAVEIEKRRSKDLESNIRSLNEKLKMIPEGIEEKPQEKRGREEKPKGIEEKPRGKKGREEKLKEKEEKPKGIEDKPQGKKGREEKSKEIEEKHKPRKLKNNKLTMATFETLALAPDVIPITAPLSDKELKFYGKKPCPCANTLEELLKKAARNGLQSLTIDELQFIHKHLSEASANILERLGQKTGVLRPTEVGDRLSLLRRIAELEGDLMKKQKQTQQKIAEMQNAVKLEKDRLFDLRKKLEIEKKGETKEGPKRRISRDVEALETMKNQLEHRLNEELLNKMRLEKRLFAQQRSRAESPVRETPGPRSYSHRSTANL